MPILFRIPAAEPETVRFPEAVPCNILNTFSPEAVFIIFIVFGETSIGPSSNCAVIIVSPSITSKSLSQPTNVNGIFSGSGGGVALPP